MTSCEDDPTNGLDLPDDAGNRGGGQEAIVADNQATNLHSKDFSEEQCQLFILPGLRFLTKIGVMFLKLCENIKLGRRIFI